jgi:hypothetical protein
VPPEVKKCEKLARRFQPDDVCVQLQVTEVNYIRIFVRCDALSTRGDLALRISL